MPEQQMFALDINSFMAGLLSAWITILVQNLLDRLKRACTLRRALRDALQKLKLAQNSNDGDRRDIARAAVDKAMWELGINGLAHPDGIDMSSPESIGDWRGCLRRTLEHKKMCV